MVVFVELEPSLTFRMLEAAKVSFSEMMLCLFVSFCCLPFLK